MRRFAIHGLALALAVSVGGMGVVQASAPDNDKVPETKQSTRVVTETETGARLAGANGQTAAKGFAESKVVSVTDTTTQVTTTNAALSICVKGLTLVDGAVVTFQLNGTTLGTGTVKNGRAALRLSTRKGDTVPAVAAGDTITVIDPDGTTIDLTGTFGPLQTETENS